MALTVIWGAQSLLWAAQPEEDQDLVTIAGMPGNGYRDGMGNEARFAGPTGLDVKDRAVVIADTENNLIRSLSGQRVIPRQAAERRKMPTETAWALLWTAIIPEPCWTALLTASIWTMVISP